jgi:hypothetical protein
MVIGGGILETRAALLWAQKGVAVALSENEDRLEAPPGLVPEPVDTINKSREAVAAVFHRRKRVERMNQSVGWRCGGRTRQQTLARS